MTVSHGDVDALRIIIQEGSESTESTVTLARVGETVIASEKTELDTWVLYALELDTGARSLKVKVPNPAVVKKDIEAGIVAGSVFPLDLADYTVSLTASGEALRAYLEAKPGLFSEVLAEFERQEP